MKYKHILQYINGKSHKNEEIVVVVVVVVFLSLSNCFLNFRLDRIFKRRLISYEFFIFI